MSHNEKVITTTTGWTGIQLLNVSDKELLWIQYVAFGVNFTVSLLTPLPLISILRYVALSVITAARGSVSNQFLNVASPIVGALLYILIATAIASLLTQPFFYRSRLD